jgi:hypothetical protein
MFGIALGRAFVRPKRILFGVAHMSTLHITEGVNREAISGRGRGLVATRSFQIGEVVLEEQPLVGYHPTRGVLLGNSDGVGGLLEGLELQRDESGKIRRFSHMGAGLMAQTLLGDHTALWAKLGQICHATIPADHTQLADDYADLVKSLASNPELAVKYTEEKLRAEVPVEVYARIIGILHLNAFSVSTAEEGMSVGDSSALFHHASFANHSCDPNVAMDELDTHGRVRFVCRRPVEPGEELTVAYIDCDLPTAERREKLAWAYAFTCDCPKCL